MTSVSAESQTLPSSTNPTTTPSIPTEKVSVSPISPSDSPSSSSSFLSYFHLRHEEDRRTIVFCLAYFVLFFYHWILVPIPFSLSLSSVPLSFLPSPLSSFSLIYLSPTLLTSLPLFILHSLSFLMLCWFSFLGAVATHNSIHCPIFYHSSCNKIFQCVLSLIYGHPVSSFIPGHNLSHHRYTQQPKDIMRTTKMRYKYNIINGLFFFFYIGKASINNDSQYFIYQQKLGRPIFYQLRREQYILYSLTIIFLLLSPSKWLLYAFTPHFFAKFSIVTLNLLQHDGCDASSPYNFARNFISPTLNYFCYNNGYHTIHHLHPGMHWSKLEEEHNKEIAPHNHANLNQGSIWGYIVRMFLWPGRRVDYLGNDVKMDGEEVRDEPWFYEEEETYSTKEKFQ